MKPGFALSLSVDGISLLQRAAGGWRIIGDVSPEVTDLAGGLAGLRDKAKAYGGGELYCKLIIPNDQIRYLSVQTDSLSVDERVELVRRALEGATPYPVEDLVFDLAVDGATTHVAAAARETLAEAEAFAVEHGFNPLCFVAAPGDNSFLGEPYFGASAHAATLPGAPSIEADGIAVVVIGPAIPLMKDPAPEPEPEPEAAVEQKAPVQPATGGFSSRRTQKSTAPVLEAKPGSAPDAASSALGGAKRGGPPPKADIPPVAVKAMQSEPVEAIKPEATAPEKVTPDAISVTAPSLEIPQEDDTDTPLASASDQAADQAAAGEFLSRRKKTDAVPEAAPVERAIPSAPVAVAPVAPTAIPRAPAPISENIPPAAPELTAVSRPSGPGFVGATAATPEEEAARMTLFGARDQAEVGGKPRHLGLILSAALLLFLAGVAAWASIFLDNGIAGLFRASPAEIETAAVPELPETSAPAQPLAAVTDTSPAISEPAPQVPDTLALLPPQSLDVGALPPPRQLAQPDQPGAPGLSDTDISVLDAPQQGEQVDAALQQLATETPEDSPANELARENQAAVAYAATGIQQSAPQVPETPAVIGLGDLYVASIDRTDLAQDAVALQTVAALLTDQPLGTVNSPLAAGTEIELGPRGLVEASVEGTMNPGGVMVFLGRPPVVPPVIPARLRTEPEVETTAVQTVGQRPRLRPRDLQERFERTNLGGLSRTELSALRPKVRPASPQEQGAQDQTPTAQAVATSRVPRARPENFAAIVSAVRPPPSEEPEEPEATTVTVSPPQSPTTPAAQATTTTTVAAAVPRTTAPRIPTSVSVAREATLRHEINLRRVNLIGVYGTPSNRRALVRLPSGRYKKVEVGDSVDGGRVVAIGDSELRYQKGGRNLVLKIPSS